MLGLRLMPSDNARQRKSAIGRSAQKMRACMHSEVRMMISKMI